MYLSHVAHLILYIFRATTLYCKFQTMLVVILCTFLCSKYILEMNNLDSLNNIYVHIKKFPCYKCSINIVNSACLLYTAKLPCWEFLIFGIYVAFIYHPVNFSYRSTHTLHEKRNLWYDFCSGIKTRHQTGYDPKPLFVNFPFVSVWWNKIQLFCSVLF